MTLLLTGAGSATPGGGAAPLLQVVSVTPTPTGFVVVFNKAFDPAPLVMYGNGNPTRCTTLVGATNHALNGTLVLAADSMSFEFVCYSLRLLSFAGALPVLPDDDWTVTLVSGGSTGFKDMSGAPLDGAGNGGSGNYVDSSSMAGDNATIYVGTGLPILRFPEIARGPDSASTVKLPNNSAHGIPVKLYLEPTGGALTDVTVTFQYNPALLVVTGATTTDSVPSSGTTFVLTSNDAVNGVAVFTWHNDTPPVTANVTLGSIVSHVPDAAVSSYGLIALPRITAATINGEDFADFGNYFANGIQVVAFLADVTGDHVITSADATACNNLVQGTNTGFAAYPLLDPAIVGDVANNGAVNATSVSVINGWISNHASKPSIPVPPGQ